MVKRIKGIQRKGGADSEKSRWMEEHDVSGAQQDPGMGKEQREEKATQVDGVKRKVRHLENFKTELPFPQHM